MKIQYILVLFFLAVAISVQGQTQKNDVRIGGSGNIYVNFPSTLNNLTQAGMTVDLRPNFSYFLTNNWMLETELILVGSTGSTIANSSNQGIGFGVGCSHYFNADNKLQPFLGGGLYYGYNSFGFVHLDYTVKAGLSFFVHENIALELAVPLTYIHEFSSLRFFGEPGQLSISSLLGIQVYLRQAKEEAAE